MKTVKVLVITTAGLEQKEGISSVLLDYFSQMDREKVRVELVVWEEYSQHLLEKFQRIGVRAKFVPSRFDHALQYIAALFTLIHREKYDAIYVHGSSAILSTELVVAWLTGCKSRIAHSHSSSCQHKFLDRLLRPIFYCSYTQALACGTEAGKWLYGDRPFQIIKNGRDVETYRFSPEKRREMRQKLGLDERFLAIGHVGNFTYPKNQGYLAEVLKEVLKRKEEVRLYLMGDGERREAVEQQFREQGLDAYVVFTGNISNVPDMLQAMDIMALPSLYEGLPLVSVEWQIAALPCILSDAVTRECAYTPLVHFLPLGNPSAWADAILEQEGFDRSGYCLTAVELTRANGFDLENNVKVLTACLWNEDGKENGKRKCESDQKG